MLAVTTAATTTAAACKDRGEKMIPFPEHALAHNTYQGLTLDVAALPNKSTSNPGVFGERLELGTGDQRVETKRPTRRLYQVTGQVLPSHTGECSAESCNCEQTNNGLID